MSSGGLPIMQQFLGSLQQPLGDEKQKMRYLLFNTPTKIMVPYVVLKINNISHAWGREKDL